MSIPSPLVHEHFAHARRRGWLRHAHGLFAYPALAWRHRLLVQNFFRRELLGRFRGSFLGAFWVLLYPIFLFSIYFFIFGYVFKAKLLSTLTDGPDPSFAVYMLSGLLVVTAFMEGTSRACTCIYDNGNLVKKVAFPCELLPLHLVLVANIVFSVGLAVLLVLGLSTGTMSLGWSALWYPVVMLVQIGMSLGVGLALACIYVFMRDASQIWAMVGQAVMFLSPTFWTLRGVNGTRGLAHDAPWTASLANGPTYSLMQAHRHALGITPSALDGTLLGHLGVASLWTIGFLVFGYGLFASRREKFADLV